MYKYAMRRKVSLPGDEAADLDVSSVSVPGNFNKIFWTLQGLQILMLKIINLA